MIFDAFTSSHALPTTQEPLSATKKPPWFTIRLCGIQSPSSDEYMIHAFWSWLRLFAHAVDCALDLAFASAGKSIPARMAIMAMTTKSSIRVKAPERFEDRKVIARFMVFTFEG